MKRWLVLGAIIMIGVGSIRAQDAAFTPTASTEIYVVNLVTEPKEIEANKPFTLTVSILEPDGKTPVSKFDEVHTKLLHFILVSDDLTQFLHVHPDYQGDGVFVLTDLVLPQVANYVTFADFTPTGNHQHYIRNTLTVSGATEEQPNLVISPTEVTVGGLKLQLVNTDAISAGAETSLKFHVSDAKTGAAISSLDEYLGAAGHLVIVDKTTQIYIHTHPAGHDMAGMSGMDMATATPAMAGMDMPTQYGPDLEFMADIPSAGLWSMWLQVQYKGDVYTFPFVVDVTDNGETTPEAHAHG